MNIRVGQGYDSHKMVEGIPFYVGGAFIESRLGSKGHSDGDCLLHAVIDSILGALGKGDIGTWFPDNDPKYKGVRSTELLKAVLENDGLPRFKLINMDITLFLNKPKMSPHRDLIVKSLAELLNCDMSQLNLKAKTLEGFSVDYLIAASVTSLIELK